MRRDTHGEGSCGDRGPFDSPHGGACPTTPQTASRMTAARAAPPWPIKTQLSAFEPRVFTCVQEVFFVCSRHACIGLHADRFVIRGNHFGRALTPFLSGHDSRPKSILIV